MQDHETSAQLALDCKKRPPIAKIFGGAGPRTLLVWGAFDTQTPPHFKILDPPLICNIISGQYRASLLSLRLLNSCMPSMNPSSHLISEVAWYDSHPFFEDGTISYWQFSCQPVFSYIFRTICFVLVAIHQGWCESGSAKFILMNGFFDFFKLHIRRSLYCTCT